MHTLTSDHVQNGLGRQTREATSQSASDLPWFPHLESLFSPSCWSLTGERKKNSALKTRGSKGWGKGHATTTGQLSSSSLPSTSERSNPLRRERLSFLPKTLWLSYHLLSFKVPICGCRQTHTGRAVCLTSLKRHSYVQTAAQVTSPFPDRYVRVNGWEDTCGNRTILTSMKQHGV